VVKEAGIIISKFEQFQNAIEKSYKHMERERDIDPSLSLLGIGTSIKSGRVKSIWSQISVLNK